MTVVKLMLEVKQAQMSQEIEAETKVYPDASTMWAIHSGQVW